MSQVVYRRSCPEKGRWLCGTCGGRGFIEQVLDPDKVLPMSLGPFGDDEVLLKIKVSDVLAVLDGEVER